MLIPKVLLLTLLSTPAFSFDAQIITATDIAERVNSTNRVGLDFIRDVIKTDAARSRFPQNTLISPISAYTAFAMLHSGLRNETEQHLDQFLNASNRSIGDFDTQNSALLNALRIERVPADQQPQYGPRLPALGINNSAWHSNGLTTRGAFEFTPQFAANLKNFYSASIEVLDFADPKSASVINAWVEKSTNGLIPTIITSGIMKDLNWLLLNATYLEASWAIKFEALPASRAIPFSLLNGRKVAVDMISGEGELTFLENHEFQAVEVPFFGADLSFIVLLPRTSQTFKNWTLDGTLFKEGRWNTIIRELAVADKKTHERDVHLKLPKFSFAYSKTITKREPITALLGLDFLFAKKSMPDFSPLGGAVGAAPGTVVGIIKQDTKISLDENGVKAAAVTMIGPTRGSRPFPKPVKNIVIDRPFVFAIKSKATGALLFIGTVVDPKITML